MLPAGKLRTRKGSHQFPLLLPCNKFNKAGTGTIVLVSLAQFSTMPLLQLTQGFHLGEWQVLLGYHVSDVELSFCSLVRDVVHRGLQKSCRYWCIVAYAAGMLLLELGTKVLMPRVDYASLQPCCSLWLFVQLELYRALSLDYAVVVAMSCFCMCYAIQ